MIDFLGSENDSQGKIASTIGKYDRHILQRTLKCKDRDSIA